MYGGRFHWYAPGGSSFTISNGSIASELNSMSIHNGNVSISGSGNFTTEGPVSIYGIAYFDANVCILLYLYT